MIKGRLNSSLQQNFEECGVFGWRVAGVAQLVKDGVLEQGVVPAPTRSRRMKKGGPGLGVAPGTRILSRSSRMIVRTAATNSAGAWLSASARIRAISGDSSTTSASRKSDDHRRPFSPSSVRDASVALGRHLLEENERPQSGDSVAVDGHRLTAQPSIDAGFGFGQVSFGGGDDPAPKRLVGVAPSRHGGDEIVELVPESPAFRRQHQIAS